jgi:predicted enzyme related to lactoylglutathione lyase
MARDAGRNTAVDTAFAEAALADASCGAIVLLRFELFVADAERSVRFYEDALGFSACLPETGGATGYTELSNGVVRIGVVPIAALSEDHYFRRDADGRLGVGVEIVFEVDDIAEYERRARRANAVFEPLQHRPWGRRDFRVVDPDGYYIRVTETLSDGTRAGAVTRHRANGGLRSP